MASPAHLFSILIASFYLTSCIVKSNEPVSVTDTTSAAPMPSGVAVDTSKTFDDPAPKSDPAPNEAQSETGKELKYKNHLDKHPGLDTMAVN